MTPPAHLPATWPRAIALVDMNAFFASIEQRDHTEWRGRPVAITNGLLGTPAQIARLPVKSFMEKDLKGHSHWYDLTRGQWIQSLVARHQQERRIYVVTIEPELAEAVHDRWPRIIEWLKWCPGPESNRHGVATEGFSYQLQFSLQRLLKTHLWSGLSLYHIMR